MQNGISIFIKLHNILRIFLNIKNITIVMIGVSFSFGSTYYLSTLSPVLSMKNFKHMISITYTLDRILL